MERQELSDLVGGVSSWGKVALYSPLVATLAGCGERDSDYIAIGGITAVGLLVVGGVYAAIRSNIDASRRSRSRYGSSGRSVSRGSGSGSSDPHRLYDDSPSSYNHTFWSTDSTGDTGGHCGGGDGGYSGGDSGGDCGGGGD